MTAPRVTAGVNPLRAVVGLIVLPLGTAALLWVASLAQRAGATTEPQLIGAQVVFTGSVAAGVWAVGAWALCTALPRGSAGARVALLVAVLPWVVLAVSLADVGLEACARAGGRCG